MSTSRRHRLHLVLTLLLALVAVGTSYGWHHERQWRPVLDPAMVADNGCTIEDDVLLTYEVSHGHGDIVSVRVVGERDKVVVGHRVEGSHDGPRAAIAETSRHSVLMPGGLGGRTVVHENGTPIECTAVDLPRRRR
jgi:hypothetical protein